MTAIKKKASATLLVALWAAGAHAQFTSGPPSPPTVSLKDDNFVDMASGGTSFPIRLLSIGNDDLGLSVTVNYQDIGDFGGSINSHSSIQSFSQADRFIPSIYYYYVGFQLDAIDTFNGGSTSGNGGFVVTNANGTQTFTDRNGVTMQLANGFGTSVAYPNGKMLRYQGQVGGYYPGAWSVMQNNGLLAKRDSAGNYRLINLAFEYCDPNPAVSCVSSLTWPSANESYTSPIMTVTDSASGHYSITMDSNSHAIGSYHDKKWAPGVYITYKRCQLTPSDCGYYSQPNNTYSPMHDRVEKATKNGIDWTFSYVWNIGPHGYIYKTTNPYVRTFMGWNQGTGYPISFVDEFGRTISFDATIYGRVSQIAYPEGNFATYTYDSRGNLTDVKKYTKTNSTNPAITLHADYDTACTYPAKCNKPNYYVDGSGNRTDLTYDNVTGLILTESGPAVGGARPVKRYHYVQRSAWYLGAGGGYVQDPNPIWLLASLKYCQIGQTNISSDSCALPNDEVVTTYEYGPNSGPNNLWLRGAAVTSNGVTRRTCYSYDRLGERISTTLPKANLLVCP